MGGEDWGLLALFGILVGLMAFRACECRTPARRVAALMGVCAYVAALFGLSDWYVPWLDQYIVYILLAAFAITVVALPAILFGRLVAPLLAPLLAIFFYLRR